LATFHSYSQETEHSNRRGEVGGREFLAVKIAANAKVIYTFRRLREQKWPG
jgi:hypothetical protein